MVTRLATALITLATLLVLSGCAFDDATPNPGDAAVGTQGLGAGLDVDENSPLTADDAHEIRVASAGASAARHKVITVARGRTRYVALHLEFFTPAACQAFQVPGVHVINRFQKWADVLMRADQKVLLATARAKGLLQIDPAGRSVVPPQPKAEAAASRATPERIVRGGTNRMTGKGVIIAVVDSGVDFRHPDFITYDARRRPTSRLLYLWDTTSDNSTRGIGDKAPITYPNGVSLGTVYTRSQLTTELRSNRRRIGSTDANGHGTSCASIAAGNGNGHARKRYIGVAPDADIIAVRIGGSTGGSVENSYLLGAICAWVDRVAGTRPCVVSCSFGGQVGARDGARVIERQIDARFAQNVRGRAICIAAGNEAGYRLHARVGFAPGKPGLLQWTVPNGKTAKISLFVDDPTFRVLDFDFTGLKKLPKTVVKRSYRRVTRQWSWTITSPAGAYTMRLKGATTKPVTANAYITKTSQFTGRNVHTGMQVATPGTARQAITVGSYDFNDQIELQRGKVFSIRPTGQRSPMTVGAISRYSNPGPRVDKIHKPDLAAPGQYHIAAAPMHRVPSDKRNPREVTGRYRHFNGTSAATPYCAGVVALMFQKNPQLTVGQVRQLLTTSARRDPHTGATPNSRWGFGKLDVRAVQAAINKVPTR